MYAIVKTGGKQYRVEQGQSLLVERLPVSEGESVSLDPLLYVDGSKVVDQVDGLSGVTVEARVVAHERGPKLRVVKFKPKRGYKRRTGHRQDLTRIEVVSVKLAGARRRTSRSAATEEPAPVAAQATAVEAVAEAPAVQEAAAAEATEAPKPRRTRSAASAPAKPRASTKPKVDESEGEATPKRPAQRRPRSKPKEEGDGT